MDVLAAFGGHDRAVAGVLDGVLGDDSQPTIPAPGASLTSNRRRALRIVAATEDQATAEDVVLNYPEATHRFGANVAALIFDDQRPGALDLTYRAALLRYGAPAAALIIPAVADAHVPDVTDEVTSQLLPSPWWTASSHDLPERLPILLVEWPARGPPMLPGPRSPVPTRLPLSHGAPACSWVRP